MKVKSNFYDDRKFFGESISDMRIEKGLTQKNLAIKAGLRRPHISRAENGKNSTLDTLLKIAYALECNIKFMPKK